MSKKVFKAEYSVPRLDHFLRDSLNSISRSKMEKVILDGNVMINGVICIKKNNDVNIGDRIEITLPSETDQFIENNDFSFYKLFEDDHILVINKPPGISVHKGAGVREATISDHFKLLYPELDIPGDKDRPGIVHRLDKGTSGAMILAKSSKAFHSLQKQFRKRDVNKMYCAVLKGRLRFRSGTIDKPLIRNPKDRRKFMVEDGDGSDNSRDALTKYKTRYQFENSSYVFIKLHTGRTHQIRVHMAHLGNPVLGDELYGKKFGFSRLALHSYSIQFIHPVDKSITITSYAPIPDKFIDHFKSEIKKQQN